jgi:hypothetical protein
VDTLYRRKVNFVPGKMLKDFLKNVAVTRMAAIDKNRVKRPLKILSIIN